MSVVAFASATGAPGVTTTALAAALHWPEPALLIEADTSKTTDVMVGYFRGQLPHSSGLAGLLERPGDIHASALLEQSLPLTEESYPKVTPGFTSLAAGQSAIALWKNLPGAFYELQRAGTDILMDLGRLRHNDPRMPLLAAADQVIVLVQPQLPSVYSAFMYIRALRTELEQLGVLDTIKIVTVGDGDESDRAIARQIGSPVLTRLPDDRSGAATYSLGKTGKARSLGRAAEALSRSIIDAAANRRARLSVTSDEGGAQ